MACCTTRSWLRILFTFLRAALLKICTRCKSKGLGTGLTHWVGRTILQPGPAGIGGPEALQHSWESPPNTPDDRGARGYMWPPRNASCTAALRAFPQQSGTGPASPWPRPAPLGRARLLEAARGRCGWRQTHEESTTGPRSEGYIRARHASPGRKTRLRAQKGDGSEKRVL